MARRAHPSREIRVTAAAPSLPTAETGWIPPKWPLAQRIAFRFCCVYFFLYGLSQVGFINLIPGFNQVFVKAWRQLVPWVAIHVFNLSGPVTVYPESNGSGDSTLDYVHQFCYLAISAIGALAWSILDRRRPDYRTAHAWLRIWVRYALAITLFSYGFAKIFPVQFQPPGLSRLLEPLHSFSPMGLLWTFMGFSPAYTIFAGACETAGGLLLLFRRTTTLGALVSAAVLLNVVVLNFCYDVPVKLYSLNLLLMAVFLMAPDLGRLANVFVLNRPARPLTIDSVLFTARPVRIASIVAKILFIMLILAGRIGGSYSFWKSIHGRVNPPLYGVWQVEKLMRNGKEVPAADSTYWRRITFDFPGSMLVEMTGDSRDSFTTEYDPAARMVRLSLPGRNTANELHYMGPQDRVTLTGRLMSDDLVVEMRRIDPGFLLTHRGFHWINERPFNR
jgi:uncharacterized membrane protein YphA (DoxX/SURF4 family)